VAVSGLSVAFLFLLHARNVACNGKLCALADSCRTYCLAPRELANVVGPKLCSELPAPCTEEAQVAPFSRPYSDEYLELVSCLQTHISPTVVVVRKRW
jgi:hypothetical protein